MITVFYRKHQYVICSDFVQTTVETKREFGILSRTTELTSANRKTLVGAKKLSRTIKFKSLHNVTAVTEGGLIFNVVGNRIHSPHYPSVLLGLRISHQALDRSREVQPCRISVGNQAQRSELDTDLALQLCKIWELDQLEWRNGKSTCILEFSQTKHITHALGVRSS